MIISLSGLDGSGKSFSARLISNYLSKINKKSIIVHMGGHSIFGVISKVLKKNHKKFHEKIRDFEYIPKKNKYRSLIRFLKRITSIIDIFIFYLRIFFEWTRGNIIVCDRYFYDLLVQGQYFKFFGEYFSFLYLKLIPKPTISFFIDTDFNTAFNHANKHKHHNLNFFKKKYDLYSRLDISFVTIKNHNTKKFEKIIINEINKKLIYHQIE